MIKQKKKKSISQGTLWYTKGLEDVGDERIAERVERLGPARRSNDEKKIAIMIPATTRSRTTGNIENEN